MDVQSLLKQWSFGKRLLFQFLKMSFMMVGIFHVGFSNTSRPTLFNPPAPSLTPQQIPCPRQPRSSTKLETETQAQIRAQTTSMRQRTSWMVLDAVGVCIFSLGKYDGRIIEYELNWSSAWFSDLVLKYIIKIL